MHGETHDIEIGAAEVGACRIAYPLLDTVGSGFVERVARTDIIVDLVVGERTEGHIRTIDHRLKKQVGGGFLSKRHCRIDLMRTTAEEMQHLTGLLLVTRFAKHRVFAPDDGIRGDEQLIRLELLRVRTRLCARYIHRYICATELSGIGLVGIDGDGGEGDIQACQQFAAAGRSTTEEDLKI